MERMPVLSLRAHECVAKRQRFCITCLQQLAACKTLAQPPSRRAAVVVSDRKTPSWIGREPKKATSPSRISPRYLPKEAVFHPGAQPDGHGWPGT